MNKRQRKKKEKKYLPIIADEFNLLTMTDEEREKAFADYEKFREKYAYRKRYKDLKKGKRLRYYYPIGKKYAESLTELNNITRSGESKPITVTQSLDDLKKES